MYDIYLDNNLCDGKYAIFPMGIPSHGLYDMNPGWLNRCPRVADELFRIQRGKRQGFLSTGHGMASTRAVRHDSFSKWGVTETPYKWHENTWVTLGWTIFSTCRGYNLL